MNAAGGDGRPEPWTLEPEDLARRLGVETAVGLDAAAVAARRRRFGANRLAEVRQRSVVAVLIEQFRSLVVLLLFLAALAAWLLGDRLDAAAILAVLVLNALIGFGTELRAIRSMASLRALGVARVRLRRQGVVVVVAADEIVPGDLLLLEAGDVVPADARLVEVRGLEVDESALTGESLPVTKRLATCARDGALADRHDMVWRGTAVTRGDAVALVCATGMATELGRIASLVDSAEEASTPLERRLAVLGGKLLVVTLAVAVLVFVIGLLVGRPVLYMVLTAIALAVAAIPEGLPIVATIALARGMWRMARKRALVNRLSAVETLGSTTIIFTDKTGTLTENRMRVRRLGASEGPLDWPAELAASAPARHLLRGLALCCDHRADGLGDPMELALLEAAREAGYDQDDLVRANPRRRIEPFDPELMMMAVVTEGRDGLRVSVKGAPERVLAASVAMLEEDGRLRPLEEADRRRWLELDHELARDGLRVLGAAEKRVDRSDAAVFDGLVFLGLVALADPPRSEVGAAIAACREAGIAVHMVTGDQPATATAIAREVGIADEREGAVSGVELAAAAEDELAGLRERRVFARVTPAQKLELVRHWQDRGAVVAMTGDGVNDAPALKKADIGVAMGRRGTQVARDAADMVLTDDSFATIVAAVAEGRVIFGNIRMAVVYLLSCNVSEVVVVALGTALGGSTPLLPLQILYLNLLTDVFPALAMAFGVGPGDVLRQPPRPRGEEILERWHWRGIVVSALVMSAAVLGLHFADFVVGHRDERGRVTMTFLCLALAQLWHVLDLRAPGSTMRRNEILGNAWLGGSILLCLLLLLLAAWWSPLAAILGTRPLEATEILMVLLASLPTVVLGQILLRRGGRGYFAARGSVTTRDEAGRKIDN
ncbi:MAG: cation-transporting P-type ATPase [Planctomycetes bacterium]|nr:cation-transporting P-type ATPase [Planctomycetota bacterium]